MWKRRLAASGIWYNSCLVYVLFITHVLLVLAAGLTTAWLFAAQRRLVARAARRFAVLPRVEQVLLVVAVGVMTVCAQKSGSKVVFNAEIAENGRRGEEVSASFSVTSNTSMLRAKNSLTTNDIARGFALTRVGTNEVFDFSAPEGANYATNWMLHGGATARMRLRFDDWTFPFGDGCLTNLTAFMFGVIAPDLYNENLRIAPLQASMGFVAGISSFWHLLTPSNSLIITWQNVLLHRLTENPVSFQVEFFANGDFTYRYDFSRLSSDAVLTNAYVIAAPGVGEQFVLGEYSLTRRFRSLGGAEEIFEEGVSSKQ